MRWCLLRRGLCVSCVLMCWRFRSGACVLVFACRTGVCLFGVMFGRSRTCWSAGAVSGRAATSCVCAFSVCRAFPCCAFVWSGGLGWHHARALEVPRFCRRRDRRFPVVHGSKLTSVGSRCVLVFGLCCCRPCMLLVRVSFFLRGRFPAHSTRTVKASTVDRCIVVDHRLVVHIMNLGHVHVIHRSVVVEIVSPPISAFITFSHISIAVIYPAIETDTRAPVTVIP